MFTYSQSGNNVSTIFEPPDEAMYELFLPLNVIEPSELIPADMPWAFRVFKKSVTVISEVIVAVILVPLSYM